MFDREKIEMDLIKEMYSMPGQNFNVKILYKEKNSKEVKSIDYTTFDSPPYFPRINRFYEFCIDRMPKLEFIDYHATETSEQILRYSENIEKEFIIH
jgi:hypothetical protein|tara:strand:- start:118 stop:408 length:291 start_codon:yes stop_codon:yes gene_type:complete